MMDNALGNQLWATYENLTLRDGVASFLSSLDFNDYFLGLVAFKYLSEKLEIFVDRELEKENKTFEEAWILDEYKAAIKSNSLRELGYFVEPKYLFKNVLKNAKSTGYVIEDLGIALKSLGDSSIGTESEEDFASIFEDIDLNSTKIGKNKSIRNKVILETMRQIRCLNFNVDDEEINYLGDAYEFLINKISRRIGRRAGVFYTPKEVSNLLAKIISHDKDYVKNAYDPACGSASSLLEIGNEIKVGEYFAQEINHSTYNIARMNMILHGIDYREFDIEWGDSLTNPLHKGMKFDAIVSNPPASLRWKPSDSVLNDERFSFNNVVLPKSNADYAFILHMFYHLEENGTMAIAVPPGVLFRNSKEKEIRKFFIDNNYLDAVIGLPANLFYGTSIPTVILVFKKSRIFDNILFIDASKEFKKQKGPNKLRQKDIEKIISVYASRSEIEKYSANVSFEKIRENEYNLNIPRYIDTFVEKEPIDVDKLYHRLDQIADELKDVNSRIEFIGERLNINLNLLD